MKNLKQHINTTSHLSRFLSEIKLWVSLVVLFVILQGSFSSLQAQDKSQPVPTPTTTEDPDSTPKGKITIKTSEPGAVITILNRFNMVEVKKKQTKDSGVYQLKAGMYRVEVNTPNYLSQVRDLYVTSGMDEVMFFDLQPYIIEKKGIFGAAYNGGPNKKKNSYTKYFVGLGVSAVVLGAAAILLSGNSSSSTLPNPPPRP
ncbi:MAG: hypothetical protein GW809_05200 [Bacteroidetes bacterium]|nr:hypothetical protein [Bacteroidota bacterium]